MIIIVSQTLLFSILFPIMGLSIFFICGFIAYDHIKRIRNVHNKPTGYIIDEIHPHMWYTRADQVNPSQMEQDGNKRANSS